MRYTHFARYYDSLYRAQGKDYEREACRLHRLIQQHKTSPGHHLLDVGCGTGEHLRYLQAFYQVEGLDASEEMLAVARRKLPHVPFHLGDMRSFQLDARFDAITCLFGTIGYVETWEGLCQAVDTMYRHLAPGGVLIIEPWLGPEEISDGRPHLTVADEPERKIVRLGHTRVRGRISEVHFHFAIADRGGIHHHEEIHRLGLFTQDEYTRALEMAGLHVTYNPQGIADRGVYIAHRPQN